VTARTTRRAFLGAVAAVVATAAGATRPWRFVVEVERRPLEARLAHLLHHHEAAAAIGRAATSPEGSETIVRSLATRLAGGVVEADAADDDELRAAASRAVAADFAARDTVTVDGWVLARTEVELCVLAARSSG
jgi:hypothetical protein